MTGLFRSAVAALDLSNAARMVRMGLRENQLGGVLGAYFRGATLPKLTGMAPAAAVSAFRGAESNLGRGIFRGAALGLGGMAAARMTPRNDVLAGAGAAAAFAGTYRGLGAVSALTKGTGGQITRGAAGLMAGSMIWSGLRTQRAEDFLMRG